MQEQYLNADQIEEYIDRAIDNLAPEIQDRFVYRFDQGDGITGKKYKTLQFANCACFLKPPVITFFTKVMEQHHFLPKNIDGVINHEIIHTFYGMKEAAAQAFQDTINFHHKK